VLKLVEQPWLLPRPANSQYTGYSEILTRLEKSMALQVHENSLSKRVVCVLSGMGGVGKSETVLQFAEKNEATIRKR